jgi:hypothetical protein
MLTRISLIFMRTIKPKQQYSSILISMFVLNVLTHTLVHAVQTISGVQRLEEGIAAYEHGEYDDAIFKIEMAVYQIQDGDKDKLWDAHFYLGLSSYLAGDNGEARKQFIKAQGIIENKLPDEHMHSHKIVKLFEESISRKKHINQATIHLRSSYSKLIYSQINGLPYVTQSKTFPVSDWDVSGIFYSEINHNYETKQLMVTKL